VCGSVARQRLAVSIVEARAGVASLPRCTIDGQKFAEKFAQF
jgi:hypothetical protein